VRSVDTILDSAGGLTESFRPASDCGFDSGALRAELDIVELDGIELCIGLGDGLGAGALCIAGALAGEGALGAECEMLGAEDGGEKLGAELGEGALGAEPVS